MEAILASKGPDLRPVVTKHGWQVLVVLSLLLGFASISTDFYLPAMPQMATSLGALPGSTEWTVSGYLAGFSLGQLFWGPVGDRFGRRWPIAMGILLFVAGSGGCAISGTIGQVIAWRLLQAIGASACVVLGRAIVRDLYEGNRAAEMMATLMTVMAVAPLIGPLIGAQVLTVGGWRSIFWLLTGIGAVALAAVFTLPESLPAERRNMQPLGHAFGSYRSLLREPQLLGYAGAGGFFYGGMFAYIAGAPFAYIAYYHISPRLFGLVFGLGVLGIMGSNLANAGLVARFGTDKMLKMGTGFAAVTGTVVALCAQFGLGGRWGLIISLLAFIAATGFIVANSVSGALAGFPERAGAVSAFVGALQYGTGILGSALVGALANGTPAPLGWVVAAAGICSLFCAQLIRKPKPQ